MDGYYIGNSDEPTETYVTYKKKKKQWLLPEKLFKLCCADESGNKQTGSNNCERKADLFVSSTFKAADE